MNLLYYTRPDFVIHAQQLSSGGMGTKTQAIMNAWQKDHNITITSKMPDETEQSAAKTYLPPEERGTSKQYDVILIELMGLLQDPREDMFERCKVLGEYPAPKLVYGSDSEIFRWTGKELDALKEIVSLWIPNMEWQGSYFRDFDLAVSDVVYEPIDCDTFRPAQDPKMTIVAGGAISCQKQSDFFIELFSKLKELNTGNYKTEYLGSGMLWDKRPKPIDMRLQHELKQVTDKFHGTVPQNKVASVLSQTAVAVLNPHYETCNRFDMEIMASGVPHICGPHVCYNERPTSKRFDGSVEDCIEQLKEITNDWTELPEKSLRKEVREYAVDNFSYEASLNQLNTILRSVL